MSGPDSGWKPDGTPAGSDPNAPQQPATPQQPAAPQQASYGDAPPPYQASYGDTPQQPTYGSPGADPNAGGTGFAAMTPPSQPDPGQMPPPPYPDPGQMPPPPYPDQSQYGGPTQAWTPPAAPPPKKSRPWVGIVILIVVAVVIVGVLIFRDRLSGSATDLSVGDCIDEPVGTTDITDVQHQPCNEPHDGEVFAVFNHTAASGAPYPASTEFRDLVQDECLPALEAYTARTYDEVYAAGLDVSFLYPSSSSWSDGDREVSCFVVKIDETKMTGTVRAGGSTPAP